MDYKKEVVKLLNEGKYKEADVILDKFAPGWRDVEIVESK